VFAAPPPVAAARSVLADDVVFSKGQAQLITQSVVSMASALQGIMSSLSLLVREHVASISHAEAAEAVATLGGAKPKRKNRIIEIDDDDDDKKHVDSSLNTEKKSASSLVSQLSLMAEAAAAAAEQAAAAKSKAAAAKAKAAAAAKEVKEAKDNKSDHESSGNIPIRAVSPVAKRAKTIQPSVASIFPSAEQPNKALWEQLELTTEDSKHSDNGVNTGDEDSKDDDSDIEEKPEKKSTKATRSSPRKAKTKGRGGHKRKTRW
jgi:hypothetical protein